MVSRKQWRKQTLQTIALICLQSTNVSYIPGCSSNMSRNTPVSCTASGEMFLHLSDCHIATEVNAKPVCASASVCVCVCVFPKKASSSTLRSCNTALITHPLTFLKAHFERGRENPNQLNATERTLMSRERILHRSRCSAIFSPRRMSESRAADGRAGRFFKTAQSSELLHPCTTPVIVRYLPAVFTQW